MRGSTFYNLLNFKVLMIMCFAPIYKFYLKINNLLIKVEHRVNSTLSHLNVGWISLCVPD